MSYVLCRDLFFAHHLSFFSYFTLFLCFFFFFFFNDTATTEIYTLSLHDALPISRSRPRFRCRQPPKPGASHSAPARSPEEDRKSTRLNSSHPSISYAVFCLKKKKKTNYKNIH